MLEVVGCFGVCIMCLLIQEIVRRSLFRLKRLSGLGYTEFPDLVSTLRKGYLITTV